MTRRLIISLVALAALASIVAFVLRPRARRSRHGSYLAAASLLALGAVMGTLISLSLSLGGEHDIDPLLSFVVPALTLGACGFVVRRGMLAPPARRHRPG